MNYKIVTTDDFKREIKFFIKKYHSFLEDLKKFEKELLKNPEIGDKLGDNTRKIRMAIASKGKGKRGGARIIACNVLISIENTNIYLLTIYDKSEQDSITEQEIRRLKEYNGLQ